METDKWKQVLNVQSVKNKNILFTEIEKFTFNRCLAANNLSIILVDCVNNSCIFLKSVFVLDIKIILIIIVFLLLRKYLHKLSFQHSLWLI